MTPFVMLSNTDSLHLIVKIRLDAPCDDLIYMLVWKLLTGIYTVTSACGYSCHVHCADKAPQTCPVPSDQCKWLSQCNVMCNQHQSSTRLSMYLSF